MSFFDKSGLKIQSCLIKMELCAYTNSDMLRSMVMFICPILDLNTVLGKLLFKKLKLSKFYHGVRRSQNETGVKKVDLK